MEEDDKDIVVYSLTDIGRRRRNNEDSFLYIELEGKGKSAAYLLAVADGMGGHAGGEVASRCMIKVLEKCVTSNPITDVLELLRSAIKEANRSIHEMSRKNSELLSMGTTCTAMLWTGGSAYIAHVGDSRAYLVRKGETRRLTKDHTVVEQMVRSGIITPEEAGAHPERNMLIRAVGINPNVEVDLLPPIRTIPGDIFVLCSDGLTEFVREDELGDIVTLHPPDEACHVLVSIANERGGTDNITVQIAKILGKTKKASRIFADLKNLFQWMG
ncbi:MAG: Stp1/IreP family PP2C-type Ser/Thr phosphatase [Ignavibacteriales bacterium]